jgi:hypothetical protein
MRHVSVPAPDNLDARLCAIHVRRKFPVAGVKARYPTLKQRGGRNKLNPQRRPRKHGRSTPTLREFWGSYNASEKIGFVSCWTKSDTENFAFWRIYGRNESVCANCGQMVHTTGQSVAVATTYRKLEIHLPAFVDVGVVGYSDYVTAGVDRYNMLDHIMNKRRFYRYESEVRAITNLGLVSASEAAIAHIKSNMIDGSYAPPVNISSLIDEVILHPESSEVFAQEITTLCSQRALPIPRLSGLTP